MALFFICIKKILSYICDTGYIGPVNHVQFDEGINGLPFERIPLDQCDLEQARQGDNFFAEPIEVDTQVKLQQNKYTVRNKYNLVFSFYAVSS